MGCTSALSGCVLVVVNILFFIIGLAFAAAGGIISWGQSIYTSYLRSFLLDGIKNLNTNTEEITKTLDDMFKFLSGYGIAIFVIGLVFVFISLLAMCGVCCKSKCIIGTYAAVIGIIAGAFLALTVVLYVKPDMIKNYSATFLTKFVQDNYVGTKNLTNPTADLISISGVLDFVQIKFECCGVTNYTDFYGATKWKRNYTVTVQSLSKEYYLDVPISCCKGFADSNVTALDTCMSEPNSENSNMYNPCYSKLWNLLQTYWKFVQYSSVGITVFLFLIVIVAFCATRFDDDKIDPL